MNYKEHARRLRQTAEGPHARIMTTSADVIVELLERAKKAERKLISANMRIESLQDRITQVENGEESSRREARAAIKDLYSIKDCRTCLYEYGGRCLLRYEVKGSDTHKDCPYAWKG